MNIVEEFKARGLLAQCTDEAAVTELLEKEKVSFYVGFDQQRTAFMWDI